MRKVGVLYGLKVVVQSVQNISFNEFFNFEQDKYISSGGKQVYNLTTVLN